MDSIDYRLPLQAVALTYTQVPTNTGSINKAIQYKVAINWENIHTIEEFNRHWEYPQHIDYEKVVIILNNGMTIVGLLSFNTLIQDYSYYKIWKEENKLFFKRNNN